MARKPAKNQSKARSGVSTRAKTRPNKAEKISLRDGKSKTLSSAVNKKKRKKIKASKREETAPDKLKAKQLQEVVWGLEDQRKIREESYYPTAEAHEKWANVVSAMVKKIQFLPNRLKSQFPDQVSSEMINFVKRELLGIKQVAVKSLKENK